MGRCCALLGRCWAQRLLAGGSGSGCGGSWNKGTQGDGPKGRARIEVSKSLVCKCVVNGLSGKEWERIYLLESASVIERFAVDADEAVGVGLQEMVRRAAIEEDGENPLTDKPRVTIQAKWIVTRKVGGKSEEIRGKNLGGGRQGIAQTQQPDAVGLHDALFADKFVHERWGMSCVGEKPRH